MFASVKSSTLVRDLRAESRALGQAWLSLQDEVEQLERHKNLLRHEWKDLEEERERLKKERDRFEKIVSQEWFPTPLEKMKDGVVKVNVGGQIFEVSSKLLLKDRFSLLAATCVPPGESILRPDEDGCFYFDRDWFLFRFILTYLQSETLPKEPSRLRELYQEAGFYCLGSMQRKIKTVLEDMDNVAPETEEEEKNKYLSSPLQGESQTSRQTLKAASASKQRKKKEQRQRNAYASPRGKPLPDPYGFTSRSTSYKF